MKEFLVIIEKRTATYNGPHVEILRNLPHLYALVTRLVARQLLPSTERSAALAVIGYCSVHDDVMSVHDFGADGYLDDAYLCCRLLRRLRDVVGEEDLYEHWGGDVDLRVLLDQSYVRLEEHLGRHVPEILSFAGLSSSLE